MDKAIQDVITKEKLEKLTRLLFKHKIIKGNCWELPWKTSKGYSCIWLEGQKYYLAHRVSAAYHLGLDLNDRTKLICHKNECNNRRCWNPEHIYIGDYSSNSVDKFDLRDPRMDKTHCKHGHNLSTPDKYYYSGRKRTCKMCVKISNDKRYKT